jgi:hypothetical protein
VAGITETVYLRMTPPGRSDHTTGTAAARAMAMPASWPASPIASTANSTNVQPAQEGIFKSR